jgi:hypothetical protein
LRDVVVLQPTRTVAPLNLRTGQELG